MYKRLNSIFCTNGHNSTNYTFLNWWLIDVLKFVKQGHHAGFYSSENAKMRTTKPLMFLFFLCYLLGLLKTLPHLLSPSRQSQSPAWVGGFGTQPSQAQPGPVMNQANFGMAGYQTQ